MKLIRPALSCSNNADNMAILKRSVCVVFSKDYIYFRFPSEQEVSVHLFSFPKHDVLKDTSKPIYSNYKKDGPVPLDFEDKIAWESEWLKGAFRKFDAPQAESRHARASDAPPPPPLVHAVKLEMSEFDAAHAGLAEATFNDPVDVNNDPGGPSTPPASPSRPVSSVNIKKKQFEAANASFILGAQARGRSLASSGAVIDLSSSPSKSLRGSQDLPDELHILPDWTGKPCPRCSCGRMSSTLGMDPYSIGAGSEIVSTGSIHIIFILFSQKARDLR